MSKKKSLIILINCTLHCPFYIRIAHIIEGVPRVCTGRCCTRSMCTGLGLLNFGGRRFVIAKIRKFYYSGELPVEVRFLILALHFRDAYFKWYRWKFNFRGLILLSFCVQSRDIFNKKIRIVPFTNPHLYNLSLNLFSNYYRNKTDSIGRKILNYTIPRCLKISRFALAKVKGEKRRKNKKKKKK